MGNTCRKREEGFGWRPLTLLLIQIQVDSVNPSSIRAAEGKGAYSSRITRYHFEVTRTNLHYLCLRREEVKKGLGREGERNTIRRGSYSVGSEGIGH